VPRPQVSPQAHRGHKSGRRDLTKGQQAMALAMIYPEAPGRGKNDPAKRTRDSRDLSHDLLDKARAILRQNTSLAQDVLA